MPNRESWGVYLWSALVFFPEMFDPQVLILCVELTLWADELVMLVHVKVEALPPEACERTQVALEQSLPVVL